ncbi:MAG TPA: S49 family peptidase, partial [Stellaceae bacterium]|nr:S49 family peptidase [Stellaceae bacterium]
MRRFVVGFFAVIGLAVVSLTVLVIAVWYFAAPSKPQLAEANILTLDLTKALPEGASGDGIERAFLGEQTTLRDVLDGLERAGTDPRVRGVIAHVGGGALGTAQVQELRDAVATFRSKGKFAIAQANSFGEFGSGTRDYYLATAFDQVWLQPFGDVGLIGLRVETPFFHDALEKLGVQPRFEHRSEY